MFQDTNESLRAFMVCDEKIEMDLMKTTKSNEKMVQDTTSYEEWISKTTAEQNKYGYKGKPKRSVRNFVNNWLPQELKWIIMSYAMEHPCKKEIEADDGGRVWGNSFGGWGTSKYITRAEAEMGYITPRENYIQNARFYWWKEHKLLDQFKMIKITRNWTKKKAQKLLKDNNVKGRSKIDYKNREEVIRALIKA